MDGSIININVPTYSMTPMMHKNFFLPHSLKLMYMKGQNGGKLFTFCGSTSVPIKFLKNSDIVLWCLW